MSRVVRLRAFLIPGLVFVFRVKVVRLATENKVSSQVDETMDKDVSFHYV